MIEVTYTIANTFTEAEYELIRELYRPENPLLSTRRLVAIKFLRQQYCNVYNNRPMDLKKAVDICDSIGEYVRKNDV